MSAPFAVRNHVDAVSTAAETVAGRAPVTAGGLARALLGLARLVALAACPASLVLARYDAPWPVPLAWLAGSVAALCVLERRGGRGVGGWVAYVAGFVLFANLRTLADDSGLPVWVAYPAEADRALFGGMLPTSWLQERLHEAGTATALDVAVAAVYLSYFVVPHAVALVLWRRESALFRRYVVAVLLAVYGGLAVSFAAPTAPPWLAGQLGGGVEAARVLAGVLGWRPEEHGAEGGVNAVAAMPSLHFAVTVLVALVAWRVAAMRPLGSAYGVAMAFTLVYAGEHYVSDLLAGCVVAAGAWLLAGRVAPRGRAAPARRAPSGARPTPTPSG